MLSSASTTCSCHGNAQYCRQDHLGELYCINCQRNTEGRHCENCKEGYHHQRAGDNCVPCNCNTAGEMNIYVLSCCHIGKNFSFWDQLSFRMFSKAIDSFLRFVQYFNAAYRKLIKKVVI